MFGVCICLGSVHWVCINGVVRLGVMYVWCVCFMYIDTHLNIREQFLPCVIDLIYVRSCMVFAGKHLPYWTNKRALAFH